MTTSHEPRTNCRTIVLFMVDQLSARWLEAARAGVVPTPNIDRLARLGTVFTNAITSNPVCCPTRATIATGLTSRQHGVLQNGYSLDPDLPTFMQALQRANWRTAALGKVHVHPHFAGLHPDYRPYGFDITHITEDPRGGEWLDWVETNHPRHYEAALATIWPTAIPEFACYGPDGRNLRDRIQAIRAAFTWKTRAFPQNGPGAYTLPFPETISQTAWITAHALDVIRHTPPGRPLFTHISYVQPHGPHCPPERCMHLVNTGAIAAPAPAEWVNDPNAPGYFADKTPRGSEAHWRHARHCYVADIAHLDEQLGAVLDALEETGRLENALIMFLADHGDLLGDHGFGGKEERHYDACIRVPLIIAGAGLAHGQTRPDMVQLEDICPTILEAAGATLPPMPKQGPYLHKEANDIDILPGRSLLPLCRGESGDAWRAAAYTESYNAIWSTDPGDWARTIRTPTHRYTLYPHNGEQLFNLETDPDEQHNLCADPQCAALRQTLRDQLLERIILQDYPHTRRGLFAHGVH